MPDYFQSAEELLASFEGIPNEDYFGVVPLNDRKVAFSIKRKYPENIRYSPARKRDGYPDNVVAIWVVYSHPSESKTEPPLEKVPVRIRIANMSLYRMQHLDYDYDDPESPTREEIERSGSTPKPIDLEYPSDYFYNHIINSFVDNRGQTVSGKDLLNAVFGEHCNTVHLIKGLRLRTSIALSTNVAAMLWLSIQFLTKFLKWGLGRTLEDETGRSGFLRGYRMSSLKKLNEDSLNIFGYKAAKPIIVIFCFVSVILGLIMFISEQSHPYLSYISKSNFLTAVHALLGLWFLDVAAPRLIFFIINTLIGLRTNLLLRGIKNN
jgi:hypothetical protein